MTIILKCTPFIFININYNAASNDLNNHQNAYLMQFIPILLNFENTAHCILFKSFLLGAQSNQSKY